MASAALNLGLVLPQLEGGMGHVAVKLVPLVVNLAVKLVSSAIILPFYSGWKSVLIKMGNCRFLGTLACESSW